MRYIFAAIFLIPLFSFADSYYDDCEWDKTNLTHDFTNHLENFLEADEDPVHLICNDYELTSAIRSNSLCEARSFDPASCPDPSEPISSNEAIIPSIAPICFYASSLRFANKQDDDTFSYCKDREDIEPMSGIPSDNGKRNIRERAPCLSQKYVESLSKAFEKISRCLEFSQLEKQVTFEMINHESAFVPNAQNSSAKCAGQIMPKTVWGLTADLTRGSQGLDISRCPSLAKKTIPPGIVDTLRLKRMTNKDNILAVVKKTPVTCPLVADPVTCLLYLSLYNKRSFNKFDEIIEGEGESIEEKNLPKEFLDKFGYYTALNTIIVTDADPEKNLPKSFIFKDKMEIYNSVLDREKKNQKSPLYNSKVNEIELISTKIQKKNLSDMEKFRNFITRVSYNGGASVVNVRLKGFLTRFKEKISSAKCPPQSRLNICEYRTKILNKESIPFEDIQKEFLDYIKYVKNKKGKPIYGEQALEYSDKTDRDIRYIKGTGDKDEAKPIDHLKKMLADTYKSNRKLPDSLKKKFQDDVKAHCQFNELKTKKGTQ